MKKWLIALMVVLVFSVFLVNFSYIGNVIVAPRDPGFEFPPACVFGECDLVEKKWCDETISWETVGYDEECGYKDYEFNSTYCEGNACDYVYKKYCNNNKWYSDYYCDYDFCGEVDEDCVFPEVQEDEICDDLLDNDWDGSIDCKDLECDCECFEGEVQECGSNEGICEFGEQTCEGGVWGECSASSGSLEICDDLDNDCDGQIDEGCECLPGDVRDCGSNVGVCNAGTQYCVEGKWSICYGATYAVSAIEECDSKDNDCDGEIDEGCECVGGSVQQCGTNVGLCEFGEQTCEGGVWGECLGGIEPIEEVCLDEQDNDCDGKIDGMDEECEDFEDISEEKLVEELVEQDLDTTNEEITDSVEERGLAEVEEMECRGDSDCDSGFECNLYGECVQLEKEFNIWLIVIPVVVLIIGIGVVFYIRSKKVVVSRPVKPRPRVEKPMQRAVQRPKPRVVPKRANPLDKALEKSFKKSKELFKK